uniref:RING-type E3 ubiquitin transferase n=1 Tax=Oryza meridionalis TaxID=40149 RepID=A0A0E0CSL5_9ORYZ
MVLMAGMLPGVECARRRRLRQGGGEASCGTRRPSLCLYAGGHDHALLGSSASKDKHRSDIEFEIAVFGIGIMLQQQRSACEEQQPGWWTLDSNVREAKERLDQKLRSQRESAVVVKRHNKAQVAGTSSDGGEQSTATTAAPQWEVYTRKEERRRMWFRRLGRRPTPEEEEECAVCLEELRAGEAVAHLPCTHRFHWGCAVPWVQTASRCPVCRAAVYLASPAPAAGTNYN